MNLYFDYNSQTGRYFLEFPLEILEDADLDIDDPVSLEVKTDKDGISFIKLTQ